MDIIYFILDTSDPYLLAVGLTIALAAIGVLLIVLSSFDIPLLRKYLFSGKFSLRTMFTLNTVIAVDVAFLRSQDVQFHSLLDSSIVILLTILFVTPGSYVVVSLLTICLQGMFLVKSLSPTPSHPLPETVSFMCPFQDEQPESAEVNFDFLANADLSAQVGFSEPPVEKESQGNSTENTAEKYAHWSTKNIHPT